MNPNYDRAGIQFQYPENWTLSEESGTPVEVSVQSPTGAFWSLSVHQLGDSIFLKKEALSAILEEYKDCEVQDACEYFQGHVLQGHDISFYWLDLLIIAKLRLATVGQQVFVLLSQCEDREFQQLDMVFRAITASLFMQTGTETIIRNLEDK